MFRFLGLDVPWQLRKWVPEHFSAERARRMGRIEQRQKQRLRMLLYATISLMDFKERPTFTFYGNRALFPLLNEQESELFEMIRESNRDPAMALEILGNADW